MGSFGFEVSAEIWIKVNRAEALADVRSGEASNPLHWVLAPSTAILRLLDECDPVMRGIRASPREEFIGIFSENLSPTLPTKPSAWRGPCGGLRRVGMLSEGEPVSEIISKER